MQLLLMTLRVTSMRPLRSMDLLVRATKIAVVCWSSKQFGGSRCLCLATVRTCDRPAANSYIYVYD